MSLNFNRNIWTKNFISATTTAEWLCSKCFQGSLERVDIRASENREHFTAIFQCTNSHCKKQFTTCGKIVFWSKDYGMQMPKVYTGKTTPRYHPFFFYPEIHLFKIPVACSFEVKREIASAFKHFWSDYDATLNALRRSLEYLMDQLEIPASERLHQRLLQFGKKYPELDDSIQAVKLMGNAGSHKDIVSKEDVLDAMEIYYYILCELFPDNRENDIKAKAKKIIEEKGKK